MRCTSLAVLGGLSLVLAGCGTATNEPGGGSSGGSSGVSEQTSAATAAAGVLLDSSIEEVLAASSGNATRSADPGAPDLLRLGRGVNTSYDLATLTLFGSKPFATAQGTVSVVTTGAGVASWPSGGGQLYTGSVNVTWTGVQVVTKDGDKVILADGGFAYTLEATLVSRTDDRNWVVTTQAVMGTTKDLAGTVTHGTTVVDFTLGGRRKVDTTITRVKTLTVNTRTSERTVWGDAPAIGVATTSTSTDVHKGVPGYSAWSIASSGVRVTWNRYAKVKTVLDLTPTIPTATITSSADYIYLSTVLIGISFVSGPMTIQEAGQLVKAKLDPNAL